VGLASEPASNTQSCSISTSGLTTVPIDPSIWEELAMGALRVAPINPAVSGCEAAIEL